MLKKKSIIPHDKPVYREVIPQALTFAWQHPAYWLLGIFAAVLQSGGSIDIFWKFWNSIQNQSDALFSGDVAMRLWQNVNIAGAHGLHWLPYAQALVILLTFFVIFVAIILFSCICQGGLVYAIGTWHADKKHFLRQALTVGSQALVPILVLNVIILAFIWIARFGVSFPLAIAIGNKNALYLAVYIVSFVVFLVLTLSLAVMQIYALNAMILQGATLAQAFARAWSLIKEHWLVTIETAIIQAVISFMLALAAVIGIIILSFPSVILFVFAMFTQNIFVFQLALAIFVIVSIIFGIFVTGYVVSFQYSVWTIMFRKFGEGGVIPKIYRFTRMLFGKYNVPQS